MFLTAALHLCNSNAEVQAFDSIFLLLVSEEVIVHVYRHCWQ